MTTYITVAIPFVNAAPHLGYAYELVVADILARTRRAAGEDVRFLGGTDDNSLKNVLAAESFGVSVRDFVDVHSARFEALAGPLDVAFDDFIRTSSDPRHVPGVQRLWRLCAANGDLYQRTYSGDYCVGCERFYDPDELVDGCCPEHVAPLERVDEENWFFRLSRYQLHLERIIASGELEVQPAVFRDEVLAFIRGGLADISISRSRRRARGWGVPVPGASNVPDADNDVVYVWFDALANYVTALGFGDPDSDDYRRWWTEADERIHVVGKGIVRFHAVFWPAFLASAGQPAPTRIVVHPYLTVDGAKISKSAGNGVDPVEVVAAWGADALRWWFAREVAPATDADFTVERLLVRANDDLANGLGNVVSRITTLVRASRPDGLAGPQPALDAVAELVAAATMALAGADLRLGAQCIVDAVTTLNRDLEATAPWLLAREERGSGIRRPDLDVVLGRQLSSAQLISAAVAPIVPSLAARLAAVLEGESAGPAFTRLELASH